MSQQPYRTMSEAMQEKFKTSKCPRLHDCGKQITNDYFKNICIKPKYLACIYFAQAMEEAHTPFTWLQKNATTMNSPTGQENLNT